MRRTVDRGMACRYTNSVWNHPMATLECITQCSRVILDSQTGKKTRVKFVKNSNMLALAKNKTHHFKLYRCDAMLGAKSREAPTFSAEPPRNDLSATSLPVIQVKSTKPHLRLRKMQCYKVLVYSLTENTAVLACAEEENTRNPSPFSQC